MSPTVLPLLREADYQQFQQMIPELRAISYDEWRTDYQKAVDYRRSRNGSKGVPVAPLVFSEWLKTNRRVAHLELLWEFAERKAEHI